MQREIYWRLVSNSRLYPGSTLLVGVVQAVQKDKPAIQIKPLQFKGTVSEDGGKTVWEGPVRSAYHEARKDANAYCRQQQETKL